MSDDDLMKLHVAWNDMDQAMQRVECALPHQLSEAVRRMEGERLRMRSVIQSLSRPERKQP